jgi:DNA-3-methyladenine glycosylase I
MNQTWRSTVDKWVGSDLKTMTDYKSIFDGIESTLFKIGSRKLSRDQIRAELEPFKHFEGKRVTGDECYKMLVHIVFYSGFRAATVTSKLPVIDHHFPNYNAVAEYGDPEFLSILNDPQMIRNRLKIAACIENARRLKGVINKYGSFQEYLNALPPAQSDEDLIGLRDKFRELFKFLGERTAFHFMMDIGLPVLKPDRVIERIFKRLALVHTDLEGDALYVALVQEGRRFARATGHPIRYIDIVFVAYGQAQSDELGLERGICLEVNPSCSVCGVTKQCDYYSRSRRASA